MNILKLQSQNEKKSRLVMTDHGGEKNRNGKMTAVLFRN